MWKNLRLCTLGERINGKTLHGKHRKQMEWLRSHNFLKNILVETLRRFWPESSKHLCIVRIHFTIIIYNIWQFVYINDKQNWTYHTPLCNSLIPLHLRQLFVFDLISNYRWISKGWFISVNKFSIFHQLSDRRSPFSG